MEYCIYCGKMLEDGQTVCPQCSHEIKEYRYLDEYTWNVLPAAMADEIETQKTGFLGMGKGDLKKMAEAVRNGDVGVADIIVESLWEYEERDDDGKNSYGYADFAADDGCPSPVAVRVLDSASPKQLAAAVLLKYTVRNDTYYVILDTETAQNIPAAVRSIMSMANRETLKRSMPILEGSLADKGIKFVAGLFGKKK